MLPVALLWKLKEHLDLGFKSIFTIIFFLADTAIAWPLIKGASKKLFPQAFSRLSSTLKNQQHRYHRYIPDEYPESSRAVSGTSVSLASTRHKDKDRARILQILTAPARWFRASPRQRRRRNHDVETTEHSRSASHVQQSEGDLNQQPDVSTNFKGKGKIITHPRDRMTSSSGDELVKSTKRLRSSPYAWRGDEDRPRLPQDRGLDTYREPSFFDPQTCKDSLNIPGGPLDAGPSIVSPSHIHRREPQSLRRSSI
jgi:hypothetical protein